MARRNPDRSVDRASFVSDLDYIFLTKIETLCCSGTDQRDIVPNSFCERFRQLLQPCIVRESAVIDCGIGTKDNFERGSAWQLLSEYFRRG